MKVKGWKDVFRFSFMQQVKTKSFIISTIVIALIAATMAFLADFLPTLLLEDELNKAERAAAGENILTVETIYVSNETGYEFDLGKVASDNKVTIKDVTPEEADAKIKEIADTTERAVVAKITAGDSGFAVNSRYAAGQSGVDKYDSEMLNSALADAVRDQVLLKLGVPEDSIGLFGSQDAHYLGHYIEGGKWYGIPYRALLPKFVENLLVAGRMISSDWVAHMSTRLMVSCFVQGQAAGTAAALSIRNNCTVRQLDAQALRSVLRANGVFLDNDEKGVKQLDQNH